MSEQIYINYGAFGDWATKFETKNNEMRKTLEDIKSKINSLQGDYESNAAVTIRGKITGMTPRFDSYQQVVDQYVKFLRNAAQQTSTTEASIDSNAQSFV